MLISLNDLNIMRRSIFNYIFYLLHFILFFVCTAAVFFFYCDLCSLCILLFAAICVLNK